MTTFTFDPSIAFTLAPSGTATSGGGTWLVTAAPTMSFDFNDGSTGDLKGTITWQSAVTDGTLTLEGVLDVTSVTSTLSNFYSAGNDYGINYTFDYNCTTSSPCAPTLASITFGTGGTATATASTGEIPVPEPGTLLLLGTGLLGLGGAIRRRFLAV